MLIKNKPSSAGGPSQIDKFKEAARELETDDSEAAFDAKLKKVAKAPPPSKADRPAKPKPGH